MGSDGHGFFSCATLCGFLQNLMTVANLVHHDSPNHGLDVAMGAVSESVKELTDSLIARISTDSSELGRGPELLAQSKKVHAQIQNLAQQVLATDNPDVRKSVATSLVEWVGMTTEMLAKFDEVDILYRAASREVRRAKQRKMALIGRINESSLGLRDMMVDLLEAIDPSPVGYLEDEVRKIHGGNAESMLASFKELATSNGFTQEAFKQRHNLK